MVACLKRPGLKEEKGIRARSIKDIWEDGYRIIMKELKRPHDSFFKRLMSDEQVVQEFLPFRQWSNWIKTAF